MSKRLPSPFAPSFLPPVARDADPVTSHRGHDRVAPKRGTLMREALALYRVYRNGLTDAEVEAYTMKRGVWKRCSDLRNAEFIEPTGEVRDGQRVCRITDAGLRALGGA